jgi:hypothetical protein
MAKNAISDPEQGGLPATEDDYDYESDAGLGTQDLRQADISLPFWKLLQSNTPEVKRLDPAYIVGAAEGLWCDTLRREVYKSFLFVPSDSHVRFLEWQDRDATGKLIADHGINNMVLEDAVSTEIGIWTRPNGHIIVPTPTIYGIVVAAQREDSSTAEMRLKAVISMAGTAAKVARKWSNTMKAIQMPKRGGGFYTPPSFFAVYTIGSTGASNDAGQSWALPTVDKQGVTNKMFPDAYQLAKDYHLEVKAENDKVRARMEAGGHTPIDYPIKETGSPALTDEEIPC